MMDTDRGARTAVTETAPIQDRTEELQCFTAVPAVIPDSNPEFRLQTATTHIARNIRCLCIGVLATPFYRFLARFSGRRRKNEPKSKQNCCSSNINNNKNNVIITNEPISTISIPTATTKVTSSFHTNSNNYNKTNLLSTFRHSSHCPSSLAPLPSPAILSSPSSTTCSSVLSSTSSTTTSSQITTSVISRSSSSSSLSPSTLLHHLLPLPPTWLWFALFASTLLSIADACSSRATPKPRPPAPTARPNVTFHTYTCPPAYAAWYCLNGATCFTVKIGDELLYNCECADGFMGPRCEYKDLDGSYLPSQRRYMLETASIAGGATIAVFLVFIVCIAAYIRVQRRAKARIVMGAASSSGDCVDSPVTYARAAPRRVFGNPPWRGTRDMYTVPMENLSVTTAENPRECVTTQSGLHWNEQQAASQQVPSSAPP